MGAEVEGDVGCVDGITVSETVELAVVED